MSKIDVSYDLSNARDASVKRERERIVAGLLKDVKSAIEKRSLWYVDRPSPAVLSDCAKFGISTVELDAAFAERDALLPALEAEAEAARFVELQMKYDDVWVSADVERLDDPYYVCAVFSNHRHMPLPVLLDGESGKDEVARGLNPAAICAARAACKMYVEEFHARWPGKYYYPFC